MKAHLEYDHAELERQFNPELAEPDFLEHLNRYAAASDRVRKTHRSLLDVAYGPDRAQKLDIFLTRRASAPVVVFLHGGGWRGGSKESRAFPAEPFCSAGAVWISIEYPLAPAATPDEMVRSLREGVAWVYRNAASFGGDREQIHVAGNSAGAHLAAILLATEWEGFALPRGVIKSAALMSGVYDLEPIRKSSANEWLHLDDEAAARLSPVRSLPRVGCPIVVAVGRNETAEFIAQSLEYFRAWVERGFSGTLLVLDGHGHFSSIGELARRGSALQSAVFAQVGLSDMAGDAAPWADDPRAKKP